MNFLNIFQPKTERIGERVNLGKVECPGENLSSIFMGLVHSMGMVNPGGVSGSSKKAVTISKNGNTYTMVLHGYTPPVKISWSGVLPIQQLNKVLQDLADQQRRVGYVNVHKMNNGQQFFQLALG